jgi:hypothetical protein
MSPPIFCAAVTACSVADFSALLSCSDDNEVGHVTNSNGEWVRRWVRGQPVR